MAAKVRLGPFTRFVLEGSVWRRNEPEYPSNQRWADEAERIFAFLETQGVLGHFLPRLRTREYEGAFAEARIAYFFKCNGFAIVRWEPHAVPGRPADLEIRWRRTESIIVEVKGPGWHAELSPAERMSGRKAKQKYIHAEARSIDPVRTVLTVIDNALPKLTSGRPTLIVVADDFFHSPVELPYAHRDYRICQRLNRSDCDVVGGVLLFETVMPVGRGVEYRHHFVANPMSTHALPDAVTRGLTAGNWKEEESVSPLDAL